MFSFIRKFFENRRKKAAERELLCEELYQKTTLILQDFVNVDKSDKDALNNWLVSGAGLLEKFYDIDNLKKTSSYRLLLLQKEKFFEFRAEVIEKVNALNLKEEQKRKDDEYVAQKLSLWVSEQKCDKSGNFASKKYKEQLEKLGNKTEAVPCDINACSCRGKNGQRKNLYSTEGEALVVADYRSKAIGFRLHVYKCPYGGGFHITSNDY